MNKKLVVIILGVIGIIMLILGLLLGVINNPNKYPYRGVYQYSDLSVYVYQEDDETIYFGLNREIRCRANIEEGSAKGFCNNINDNSEYILTITDNNLKIESNSLTIPTGIYKRVSDITLEEYFNVIFGYITSFKSDYKGMYKLDDKEIMTFNMTDNIVVLIASSETSTFVTNLIINEDNTLSVNTTEGIVSVSFDSNGNLSLNTTYSGDSIANHFVGKYNKIRSIDYMDVLKNNTYYYYE